MQSSLLERAQTAALTPVLAGFLASSRVRQHAPLIYRVFRRLDPVHCSPTGLVVLTRHADISAVLRDPAFGSDQVHDEPDAHGDTGRDGPNFRQICQNFIQFRDPPDHTRLRGLVSLAFNQKTVESLAPRVQARADGLLDEVVGRGHVEVMSEVAHRLPVGVICELMGVPPDGRRLFLEHARALATAFDPAPMRSSADEARADAAVRVLSAYLSDLVELRRRQPRDDLLSELVAAEGDGALSSDELIATVLLLVQAGHETTASVVGSAVLRMLNDRAAFSALADADELVIKSAVEELLRLDGPTQMTSRITLDAVRIDGTEIPAGRIVVLLLAAGNRDPAVFPDPARFVADRRLNPHLAFGGGAHFCLGAFLARLELRTILRTLARRLPLDARLVGQPRWRDSFTMRTLDRLDLAWSTTARSLHV